jgi:hypothetical protein
VVPDDGPSLIAAERYRQLEREGYDAAHDDEHPRGQLARAGAAYAIHAAYDRDPAEVSEGWPWADGWKPSDNQIRNLVKAGALIAAEIDRLLRLGGRP